MNTPNLLLLLASILYVSTTKISCPNIASDRMIDVASEQLISELKTTLDNEASLAEMSTGMFKKFDENRDNGLSFEEFHNFMNVTYTYNTWIPLATKQTKEIFKEYDVNKNNKINQFELMFLSVKILYQTLLDAKNGISKKFQINNKAKNYKNEYMLKQASDEWLGKVNIEIFNLLNDTNIDLKKKFDVDLDGNVSVQEAEQFASKLFQTISIEQTINVASLIKQKDLQHLELGELKKLYLELLYIVKEELKVALIAQMNQVESSLPEFENKKMLKEATPEMIKSIEDLLSNNAQLDSMPKEMLKMFDKDSDSKFNLKEFEDFLKPAYEGIGLTLTKELITSLFDEFDINKNKFIDENEIRKSIVTIMNTGLTEVKKALKARGQATAEMKSKNQKPDWTETVDEKVDL